MTGEELRKQLVDCRLAKKCKIFFRMERFLYFCTAMPPHGLTQGLPSPPRT